MELRLTFPFAFFLFFFISRFESMCMTRVGARMVWIPWPSVTSSMSSYEAETDLTLVRVWREQKRRGRVRGGNSESARSSIDGGAVTIMQSSKQRRERRVESSAATTLMH